MIFKTLRKTKGNIRATARRLSCSPNTVYLAKDEAKRKDLKDFLIHLKEDLRISSYT